MNARNDFDVIHKLFYSLTYIRTEENLSMRTRSDEITNNSIANIT